VTPGSLRIEAEIIFASQVMVFHLRILKGNETGQTEQLLGDGANMTKLLRVLRAYARATIKGLQQPSWPDCEAGSHAPITNDLRPKQPSSTAISILLLECIFIIKGATK